MNIVEKIESLGFSLIRTESSVTISKDAIIEVSEVIEDKKLCMYSAISEFVKCFNEKDKVLKSVQTPQPGELWLMKFNNTEIEVLVDFIENDEVSLIQWIGRNVHPMSDFIRRIHKNAIK